MGGEELGAGFVEEGQGGDLVEEEERVRVGGETCLDRFQVEELGRSGAAEEGGEGEAGGH